MGREWRRVVCSDAARHGRTDGGRPRRFVGASCKFTDALLVGFSPPRLRPYDTLPPQKSSRSDAAGPTRIFCGFPVR